MRFRKAVSFLAAAATLALAAFAAGGGLASGPKTGGAVYPFNPTHVTGADKGTQTCPVCKYGMIPAVQVWVNGDSMDNVGQIAEALDGLVKKEGPAKLKAFVVFIKPDSVSADDFSAQLKAGAEQHSLENVAYTYVGSNDKAIARYKINTAFDVKNTVLVYRDRKVVANYVNVMGGDAPALTKLQDSVVAACGAEATHPE
jgi:protocatechuate 3,4-dioxygenase beta subunit